jgi:5-hydroxyisourate hydrolase
MKSPITTHVLDTWQGRPAAGVAVVLDVQEASGSWKELGRGVTNEDGRIADLLNDVIAAGVYRLTFDVGGYFQQLAQPTYYPEVSVVFAIPDARQHHHVPLLLSPFGYSTYRGS